ncbi:CaiB/BaiF CoA-transferase family protein [Breoghania sp.]|uniref:CaiB/BaiF CoA transferase family protein n=1 Tax=Breoghania sp. TaxID=2065378 RepID=UPI00261DD7EC|nr:CaiB/BaiF CoA-transferase family protein [Breoghania sp.]MDJ0932662.1 CaiB/BaiF CoA-transferase family protein [Breoghania sp.]
MTLPLEGLTVVAIEQAVAAPFCTARLADAGARVVKIERPEGDFARGYDTAAAGQSSYFVWLNRGKETLMLNLAKPEAKARLAELIGSADVVVQNLKCGALTRLGFDPEDLVKANPRLIVCSIAGFGEGGLYADRKAYDLLIQAESGLCSITGTPEGPSRVGLSIVDIATGATAHAAILEALIRRSVIGKGANISVSMFDVIAEWLTVPLLNYEGGNPPKRIGLAHPSISPYDVFETRDKTPILISIQSDREWRKLCEVFIGDAALGTDERFATNVVRVENRAKTDAVVAEAVARYDCDEAIEALLKSDVALARVNNMAGLSTHPHLRRIEVDSPNGPVRFPAPAPIFAGEERDYGSVPALRSEDAQ